MNKMSEVRKTKKATKSASASAIPAGIMQTPQYKPEQIEQCSIKSIKDVWTEYTLEDNTIIKCKAILVDAKRIKEHFDISGNPLYHLQLTMITDVVAPEHLRKKS